MQSQQETPAFVEEAGDAVQEMQDRQIGDRPGWLDAAEVILSGVRNRHSDPEVAADVIKENFRVPGSALEYPVLLASLYDRFVSDPESYNEEDVLPPSEYVFIPHVSPKEVIEKWSPAPSGTPPSEKRLDWDFTKAVYLMTQAPVEWPWADFVDRIEGRLSRGATDDMSGVGQGEYAGLVGTLLTLAKRGEVEHADLALRRLNESGKMLACLLRARKFTSSFAACLLAIFYHGDLHAKAQETRPNPLPLQVRPGGGPQSRQRREPSSDEKIRREARKQIAYFREKPAQQPDVVNAFFQLAVRADIGLSDLSSDYDTDNIESFMSSEPSSEPKASAVPSSSPFPPDE